MEDRARSGRPTTATNCRTVKKIRERIRRSAARSMRKMAAEIGVSRESVRRICKAHLGLHPYKLRKAHQLTDAMKKIRLERCKQLLKRFSASRHRRILFTDECLFTIEQFYNPQNSRVLAKNTVEAGEKGRIVSRTGHPKSVMVFAGITSDGKTPLIFVESGIKIASQNYLDDILVKVILPWSHTHFGNQPWTFQQDSAPAQKARIVQQWCSSNLPAFISAKEWPPYSPNLNPMDNSVWSVLKSKVCARPHRNLESLRRALQVAWRDLDVDYLRATVEDFPKRLKACIKEKGGLFEI